jgi:peptidoglycan/LPS O-acetylase OafA/YrhL
MTLAEILQAMIYRFFLVLGGLFIASFVFMIVFGYDSLGRAEIMALLLISLFTNICALVFYSRKELLKTQIMIRQTLHLLLSIASVVCIALFKETMFWDIWAHIIVFSALMIVVYVLVNGLDLLRSKRLADDLNTHLSKRFSQ